MWGGNNKLLDAEKSGSTLFAGKAKCATCHYIPLFNGLAPPFFEEPESEVIGVPSNTSKSNAKPDSDFGSIILPNPRYINIHLNTPLRNIELSASYMHNGVYKTLEEVAEFYNKEAERA